VFDAQDKSARLLRFEDNGESYFWKNRCALKFLLNESWSRKYQRLILLNMATFSTPFPCVLVNRVIMIDVGQLTMPMTTSGGSVLGAIQQTLRLNAFLRYINA
jgi:hypothetical protein